MLSGKTSIAETLVASHSVHFHFFFFQKAAQRSERGNELVSVFCMYTNNFVILNLQIQNMLLDLSLSFSAMTIHSWRGEVRLSSLLKEV